MIRSSHAFWPQISGETPHIVIVHTDPGCEAANPGYAGMGTVVAAVS